MKLSNNTMKNHIYTCEGGVAKYRCTLMEQPSHLRYPNFVNALGIQVEYSR